MVTTLLLTFWLSMSGNLPVPPDDDPLKVNEEMKRFLEANIDRGTNSLEQLRTLVRVVFQENALNFTYVPETRTASETFTKRGGNCVSFTILFIAMARHLGLDARFREVDIVPTWSRIGNLVSMSGHANAVVFIGGQTYLVDLFPRVERIEIVGRVVSDGRALAHFYNNRGVDHLAGGRYEAAKAYFRKALDSDPTMSSVWGNLGAAQTWNGEFVEAEKSYQMALKLDSRDLLVMSNLATLYERMGRNREAKNLQVKVQKFKQKNPYYHFDLGLQAYQSGQYREAIEHLKAALKLKPVEHNFHMTIAKAYVQLGEMDKAADSLKLAAKYAPDELSKHRYNEKLSLLASMQHHS
jgi:Flp pilus assembly protein TadD